MFLIGGKIVRKYAQLFLILMLLIIITCTLTIFPLLSIFVPIRYIGLPIFQCYCPACNSLYFQDEGATPVATSNNYYQRLRT